MTIKDLKSLNPASNAKLAQREEHQTRILEDPSSILTGADRGFHKLDEIGNNANIGIRGFTM